MTGRKRAQQDVELNLASMLDMAFQILFFFVITFHPVSRESQIALRLPLAQPPRPEHNTIICPPPIGQGTGTPVGVDTLVVTLHSENGSLDAVQVGADSVPRPYMTGLAQRLAGAFNNADSPFEQVIIQCSPQLHYDQLMQVVNTCSLQKMPDGRRLGKLSFVELAEGSVK